MLGNSRAGSCLAFPFPAAQLAQSHTPYPPPPSLSFSLSHYHCHCHSYGLWQPARDRTARVMHFWWAFRNAIRWPSEIFRKFLHDLKSAETVRNRHKQNRWPNKIRHKTFRVTPNGNPFAGAKLLLYSGCSKLDSIGNLFIFNSTQRPFLIY